MSKLNSKLSIKGSQVQVGGSSLLATELGDINVFTSDSETAATELLKSIFYQIADERCRSSVISTKDLFDGYGKLSPQAATDSWELEEEYGSGNIDKALDLIKDLFPSVRNLYIDEYGDGLCVHTTEGDCHLTEMDAAFCNLVNIITGMFAAQYGFVFIGGLATEFGDASIETIALYIMECAKDLQLQIFITTDCQETLEAFESQSTAFEVKTKIFNIKTSDGVATGEIGVVATP